MKARIAALMTALALLLAVTATPAGAQERFSGLTGTVTDASGAVLPGVTVSITNKQTGKIFAAVTGADGVYRVLDLEPGRYTVKFELSGFSPSEIPDVNLLLGKTLSVDSSLRVGGVSEAISVTAESPLIDTRSTTIAHNVTAEEIERIPKGRTFQNLAVASPSVNAGQIEGGIQVNGASGAENAFTIDGEHRYAYAYVPDPGGRSAVLRATGDLDCDGEPALYELEIRIEASGPERHWTHKDPFE